MSVLAATSCYVKLMQLAVQMESLLRRKGGGGIQVWESTRNRRGRVGISGPSLGISAAAEQLLHLGER